MQAVGNPPALSKEHPARWLFWGLLILALGLHLAGVRRNLPYAPEADEDLFMLPAVRIAASGDLNPHWLGHPGSTIIYPLALLVRLWYGWAYRTPLWLPATRLSGAFEAQPATFYLLGRLLSITYAVASLPLVYWLGRRTLGTCVGLVGAWLALLSPLSIAHAQWLRTDSATVFWGLLTLVLCIRVSERPTLARQALAGVALGLAIATKYTLGLLGLFLLAVNGLALWRQFKCREARRTTWLGLGAALVAAGLAFALSTPYFFLDWHTALGALRFETQSTHLGADGLTPLGNLAWYLTRALPQTLSWPQIALLLLGAGLLLWKRQLLPLLLLGFTLVFLVGISLPSLHWQRWLIPILPLWALCAAYGLEWLASYLEKRLRVSRAWQPVVFASLVALFSAWPFYQVVLMDIRQARPSTMLLARAWILQNLPAGSAIAQEWYTAPLEHTALQVRTEFALAAAQDLDAYARQGYRYLAVSEWIYQRYLGEPVRYPREVAFYQELFQRGHLLQQFAPSTTRGGPLIRVYELSQP